MNIFWIITDAICNYERPDQFGLLPTYKNLKINKEGFYFENAISQFTSTSLSMFSMLTGRFPYFILPDYYRDIEYLPSFKDNNSLVPLKKAGYNCQAIMFGQEAAVVFKEILNPYYIENMYHGDELLDAKVIYDIFTKKINELNKNEDNFLYTHFRPADSETDYYLNKTINYLKEKDLWDESIVIINADHGYYDKKRYKKINLLHFNDIHLTSLQPAMFMKIPKNLTNIKPKTISHRVYLLDIMETVLDYLNLEATHERESISFKKLIEDDIDVNKDRITRNDCYLLLQPIRKAAIIKGNWKLYVNNGNYELFNLEKDYTEKNDLKSQEKEIYNELYQFYIKTEKEAYNIIKPMLDKLYDLSPLPSLKSESILIPKQFPPHLIKYLKEKLRLNNEIVDLSKNDKEALNNQRDLVTVLFFNRLTGYGVEKLMKKYQLNTKKYIILDTKLSDSSDRLNNTGYVNFVMKQLVRRRKQLLQRWKEIIIWVFYFPAFFNRHLKLYYD